MTLLKEPSCKEAYKNWVINEYNLNETTKSKWNMPWKTLTANETIPKKTRKEQMDDRGNSRDNENVTRNSGKNNTKQKFKTNVQRLKRNESMKSVHK